jgi:hypothetical protein
MSYDMLTGILIGFLAALFAIGITQANRTSCFWDLYYLCKHLTDNFSKMGKTARWKQVKKIESVVHEIDGRM